MKARKPFWIAAAHPDDELLGAMTLLRSGIVSGVVYPFPRMFTRARRAEAQRLGDHFGYAVRFGGAETYGGTRLALPSPTDMHAHHQEVLRWGLQRCADVEEYSIEKRAPYVHPLSSHAVKLKRALFAQFYPSQCAELTDPRYFLFEGSSLLLGGASVTVRFAEEGEHCWPQAPDEVAVLRNVHRHLFHVEVTLKHLYARDRQVEFFLVQRAARREMLRLLRVLSGDRSCEALARGLARWGRVRYGLPCAATVSEDGENGATVEV